MKEAITKINGVINGFVWGWPMLILLVGTGVLYTILTKGVQIRKFGYSMKTVLGNLFAKKTDTEAGTISPFAAMSTALAGTIGTGNVVGVTTAIVAGGPGAIFWMWVSAFFGMCTKFAEVTLAVKFRQKNKEGEWIGGPMVYITEGLGKKWKPLAVLFAAFAVLASFGIGNMTQINSIASSVNNAFGVPQLATGIVIAIITALVIIGGVKRIGQVAETIVPFMSIVYILGALIVLIVKAPQLPAVFGEIFSQAFTPRSAAGGFAGYAIMDAMKFGVKRGVFSNEAGLGSAPIAHSATSETEPVRQGVFGIFEVFIDTIIVCTMTGLVVLAGGAYIPGSEALVGAPLTAASYGSVFGPMIGNAFIAVTITLFAFTTIIGWSYYGVKCTEYLFGLKATLFFKIAFVLVIILGATMELTLVWDISDTFNGLMAIPNLVAILFLSGTVIKLTNEFFSRELK